MTLAEMLLALKKQMDRMELILEIVAENTKPTKIVVK